VDEITAVIAHRWKEQNAVEEGREKVNKLLINIDRMRVWFCDE